MASTNTLQRTVNVTQNFIRSAPLTGIGGIPNEPALSIGDWIRNFILSPPFAWRWNRGTTSFNTAPGTVDYQVNIPNFGWLEKAALVDTTVNNITSRELTVAMNLGLELAPNETGNIAARLDDDQGNVTFRITPPSNTATVINIDYQLASPNFVALTDTWNPIPDYLSFLYNQAFLAKAYEYWNDERFPNTMQVFIGSLISANGGLSESQKNIFTQPEFNDARQKMALTAPTSRSAKGIF
jgi:hypothetical protein